MPNREVNCGNLSDINFDRKNYSGSQNATEDKAEDKNNTTCSSSGDD